ncbi:MAG: hypothetical protein C5B53_01705 [Candidatus Melainabacteria bacterium]|nr:MAG: hypothetical protein C5B53_01705 [Candidatus Melainabacteria bacterium]
MRLSKFLVSVNLAAVIPIVSQAAGQAAEKAISDKAAWLKENLASMGEKKAAIKLKAQTARLAKAASDTSNGLTTQLSSLRPFVPNRKLPSQKELDQALVAQAPQLAQEPTSTLSGKISTFYNSSNPDYSHRTVFSPKTIASTGTNLKPSSHSIHQIFSNIATTGSAIAGVQRQPVPGPQATPAAGEPSETQANISPQLGFPMMRQAERYLNDQPETDEQARADQAIINRYAQMEFGGNNPDDPGNGGETFTADTAGSAGPPPFPLNLLPQASLKQLVRGMARPTRPTVALSRQPYFGSWRGGSQGAGQFMAPRNLPVAGFHSYVRSYGFCRPNNWQARPRLVARPYSIPQRQLVSRTLGRPYPTIALRHPVHRQPALIAREFLAMRRPAPPAPRVAVYPPYNSQVRLY